ncbi:nuclear transport factor 2 family protein [Arenimonas sp.]|uniref:nuclear transport factor 2 family protein n=1 Tax=Arenimonas sp. TaxID=1872635 RepID=UPI0035AF28FA
MHFPSISDAGTPRTALRAHERNWSIRSIGAYRPGPGKAHGVWFRAAFTALVLALLALAAGCARTPPEQALRETIAAMESAAEARDSDALVDHFADDFAGPGGMDRDQFRRYLALIWLRNRDVGVTLGPLEVELAGQDRARVNFTAAARGGTGWMPERAEVYQVKTGWRLEGDEWKLISADWE